MFGESGYHPADYGVDVPLSHIVDKRRCNENCYRKLAVDPEKIKINVSAHTSGRSRDCTVIVKPLPIHAFVLMRDQLIRRLSDFKSSYIPCCQVASYFSFARSLAILQVQ